MANGSAHSFYTVPETVYGVTPENPTLSSLRIKTTTLGLTKDSLQSEEIRDDRQIADFRLGANQVTGDITFELSFSSFDHLFKSGFLSLQWVSPATTGETTLNATETGYTRDAGSFISEGFIAGQTITISGFTGSGRNGVATITSVSELEILTTPINITGTTAQGIETGSGVETISAAEQIKAGVTRQSFTMVRYFSDISAANKPYYIFKGCEITSIQLTITASSMITGTFSVVGRSLEVASDLSSLGTPTYQAATTTAPLDSFTGTLEESNVSSGVITEISLTLQNGITPRFVVGSKNSILPSVEDSNLTGQVSAYFEDSTLVEKYINEVDSSIGLNLPDGAGNFMRLRLPRFKYTGGQPDVSGKGPIILAMPFQGLRDTVTGTNIILERVAAQ